jgi:rubrerythrin
MIIRLPAPTSAHAGKRRDEDIWEMVHIYQCSACLMRWCMAEDDDKPEFCPYCGKERQ